MSGKIHLDARLSAIKNLVKPCGLIADIGCDHGYLICELVKSGISKRGLACEANLGPLNRAYKTITENCLSGSIDTVLTNGLTDLPFSAIDTFIIAGMGGELIAEILLTFPQARDSRFDFILQPMTKPEKLREALFKNGFTITLERAVMCDNIVYTVMCVKYTNSSHACDIVTSYTGLLHENNDFPSRLYLRQTVHRLNKKSKGLIVSKNEKEAELYTRIAQQIIERAGL